MKSPRFIVIDGKPMAMVAHFVHKNAEGKLAVIGVAGGMLVLIPSLNDHPAWVRAATELVRRTAG